MHEKRGSPGLEGGVGEADEHLFLARSHAFGLVQGQEPSDRMRKPPRAVIISENTFNAKILFFREGRKSRERHRLKTGCRKKK